MTPPKLAGGEYFNSGDRHINNQVAGACWELIRATQRKLPDFAERLRKDVYPHYARLAGNTPDYWQTGWRFSTWQMRSDSNGELTQHLLDWANVFNLAGESWVLEGALETLHRWHKSPGRMSSLDIQGFCPRVGGRRLIGDAEHRFTFEDFGWDPLSLGWPEYRANVRKHFETALRVHEKQMRALAKARGARRAVPRYRVEHFEWLALYQCGEWSLDQIRKAPRYAADKTTISKGLHTAAKLAGLKVRAKRSKLKTP